MYTISHVAEVLGVPPATLRAWQRRYGVVAPKRTTSGYRLYDDADVQTLRTMQQLIDDGWPPNQAAVAAGAEAEGTGVHVATGEAASSPSGGDLAKAAAELDASAVARLLEEQLARGSFEQMVDGWLLPQLRHLGDAWAAGRVSIAGEHLVATTVQRRLSALYDLSGRDSRRSTIVTGLPAGSRHELGILCFAIACRRAGMTVAYLGPDLPDEEWSLAVDAHQAQAAVLAVPTTSDVSAAARLVRQLAGTGVLVGVGGRCQHQVRDACDRATAAQVAWLGHRIGPAAARVAARVGMAGQRPPDGGGAS